MHSAKAPYRPGVRYTALPTGRWSAGGGEPLRTSARSPRTEPATLARWETRRKEQLAAVDGSHCIGPSRGTREVSLLFSARYSSEYTWSRTVLCCRAGSSYRFAGWSVAPIRRPGCSSTPTGETPTTQTARMLPWPWRSAFACGRSWISGGYKRFGVDALHL